MQEPLPIERVYEILRTVDDPEIGINIVDLGFVHEVTSEPGRIGIQMALTSDTCPMREMILGWVAAALGEESDQEVDIDTTTAPPWTPDRIHHTVRGGEE